MPRNLPSMDIWPASKAFQEGPNAPTCSAFSAWLAHVNLMGDLGLATFGSHLMYQLGESLEHEQLAGNHPECKSRTRGHRVPASPRTRSLSFRLGLDFGNRTSPFHLQANPKAKAGAIWYQTNPNRTKSKKPASNLAANISDACLGSGWLPVEIAAHSMTQEEVASNLKRTRPSLRVSGKKKKKKKKKTDFVMQPLLPGRIATSVSPLELPHDLAQDSRKGSLL